MDDWFHRYAHVKWEVENGPNIVRKPTIILTITYGASLSSFAIHIQTYKTY